MKYIVAAVIFLLFGAVIPATAAPIDPFVGQWVGSGITENGAPAESVGLVDRDLGVTIEATADGFNVTWSTVRPSNKKPDEAKVSTVSVSFVGVDRPGLYRMEAARDPVFGSSYVWARVVEDRLEVHSTTISERGVLEYQKYVRTLLSEDEMQLRFTRSLDGSIVRSVLAHLTRQ